jgi:cytochrome P450
MVSWKQMESDLMSDKKIHNGHAVDVHFEPNDPDQANRYVAQMNEIRNRCPVAWSDGHWSAKDTGFWLVTEYGAVRQAALNWKLFSTAQGANPLQQDLDVFRMIPLETDPPIHTKVRSALTPFFVPDALNPCEDKIRQIVVELLNGCIEESPADFVKSFSLALPARVLFEIFLGKDPSEIGWIIELVQVLVSDATKAEIFAPKLLQWCGEVLEEHRRRGLKDDVIGVIAHAGNEPDFTLSETQRVEILNLVILGGMETTASGISSIVHTLATNPAIREQLAAVEPAALNKAVDEFLRYASPVTSAGRTLTEDSSILGCPMRKGERVTLSWTAANHDPNLFERPDVLDLERNASQHLAFGFGHHKCIGMHLAKREMRLALEEICKLRVFDLVPGTQISYRTGPQQSIQSLPVICAR